MLIIKGIYFFLFRANKNVTLYLSWNIIPNAGSLPNINGDGSYAFSFPDEYTTSKL